MNKQFILKLKSHFDDVDNRENLLNTIYSKLKKFKISRKKRFFIRYKYPHRKSESHYKSYVTIKRYLTKHKKWYTAKKKCLRFNNFEELYVLDNFDDYEPIVCNYYED